MMMGGKEVLCVGLDGLRRGNDGISLVLISCYNLIPYSISTKTSRPYHKLIHTLTDSRPILNP